MAKLPHFFAIACLMVAALVAGCVSPPPPPAKPVPPPDEWLHVLPPYPDPEFTLNLLLANKNDWDVRRYDKSVGNSMLHITRLEHHAKSVIVEVLFLPRDQGTVEDFGEKIRAGHPGATPLTASPLPSERVQFDAIDGSMQTRHVITRVPGMHHSYAYLRMGAAPSQWMAAYTEFDAIVRRLSASPLPPTTPEQSLAQCLTDKGAVLYGAWWCRPCQAQERAFGSGLTRLETVECSKPGLHDKLAVCDDAGIKTVPTWTFPDGTTLDGAHPLDYIAQQTGCPWTGPKEKGLP